MLEDKVEQSLRVAAEKEGGIALKLDCRGNKGMPDKIILRPILPEHRKIVAQYVKIIECKRPRGGIIAELQKIYRKTIKNMGYSHIFLNKKIKDLSEIWEMKK